MADDEYETLTVIDHILALVDMKLRETNRMNKCAASGIYRSTLVEIKQMIEDSKTWD